MNRKWLIAAVIFGVGAALLSNKSVRESLPLGPLSQTEPLDSSLIVTPAPIEGRPQVLISTSKGNFVIETRPDLAPQSVTNFLQKWNSGFCDGLTFHRVEDWVVQGCDPAGNGTGGELSLPTETSAQTFTTGSVGGAPRGGPQNPPPDSTPNASMDVTTSPSGISSTFTASAGNGPETSKRSF